MASHGAARQAIARAAGTSDGQQVGPDFGVRLPASQTRLDRPACLTWELRARMRTPWRNRNRLSQRILSRELDAGGRRDRRRATLRVCLSNGSMLPLAVHEASSRSVLIMMRRRTAQDPVHVTFSSTLITRFHLLSEHYRAAVGVGRRSSASRALGRADRALRVDVQTRPGAILRWR